MKKNIIIALLVCVSFNGIAQQLQTSSLYDIQGVLHNPSMAGVNKDYIGVTYKTQWQSLSGKPTTATVFGSKKLVDQKLGISGYLYNDVTGPTSRKGAQIAIAKHIPTGNGGTISLGIENRFQQFSINKSKLTGLSISDPVLAGATNQFKYDAGAGISYTDDKVQLGVSVSQLIQSKLDFYSGNLNRSEEARLYRHMYVHGLYNWKTDGETVITPNVLFIYLPNAPLEFQYGVRVEHKNIFWWGVSGRARQGFLLSAGVKLNKQFLIGYAFDIYKTPLSLFDGGSSGHEFVLKYEF